jgi:uncharacterized membrane protein required for colicin V production
MISHIELTYILILFTFGLSGVWFGFIRSLGNLLGFFAGVFVASKVYTLFGDTLGVQIATFIFVYMLVSKLVGFFAYLVAQAVGLIRMIPFVTTIDRIFGLFLGIVEGVFFLYTAALALRWLKVDSVFPGILESEVLRWSEKIGSFILPFLQSILGWM